MSVGFIRTILSQDSLLTYLEVTAKNRKVFIRQTCGTGKKKGKTEKKSGGGGRGGHVRERGNQIRRSGGQE
jgi:hypothetical protein